MIEPHPPLVAVREVVSRALLEDILPLGDMTAGLLPLDVQSSALFVSRDEGVMAGRLCATEVYGQVDPSVVIEWHLDDGADLERGSVLGRIEGPLGSLLTGERTALNFLRHLSGVATITRRFVRATRGRATLLDTRKTTPGLRTLEKAAVRAGGGTNHRGSLSDGVLIKDNHLGGMTVAEGVRRAKLRWPGRLVEVECDEASWPPELGPPHAFGHRHPAEVVVLDQDPVGQRPSMVRSPAGPNGCLLQSAKPRRGLAGVEERRPSSSGPHESASDGGHAREMP